jgi:DNA-binding CsgD family transcriptional regulator
MPGAVFGREAELGVLDGFLAALESAPAALVLAGVAGTGKTTLLREGLERAAGRGYTLLRTTPSQSDMRLAFGGLADLLDGQLDAVLGTLPAPQRRALGVALLIEDAPPAPPEPRVIAAAFRTALLELAASTPVLAVVDDVQWLDPPTAAALGFALRRLDTERVGLLCAQRIEPAAPAAPPLELDKARMSTEVLSLGGLGAGALHHLLRERLGVTFPRSMLHRIQEESEGNAFIALEIGRALARRGITWVGGGPLPVPATVSGLVGERLRELPAPVADALGAVAVLPGAPLRHYLAGVPGADLDAAVLAGLLEVDAGRLRFAHPLLASAVLAQIPPARRRELHAFAAGGATDPEEKARHQALAADGPSAVIAAGLDDAARAAELRGAPATAAELLELAVSVTPPGDRAAARGRLLAVGRLLALAGQTRAAEAILTELAGTAPPGPQRAEALAHLGWHSEDDFETSTRLLEEALAEAGGAPGLRANIHFFLSDIWAIRGDIERARAQARHAVEYADQEADPAFLASALAQAFFLDWMCGHDADEAQLGRALELERNLDWIGLRGPPSMTAGLYLMGMGRLEEAGQAFRSALARAEAEGIEYVQADVLLRLGVIAARQGNPRRGTELTQAALEIAEQLDLTQLISCVLNGCGFVALQAGQPGLVRRYGERGLDLSRKAGDRVYVLCHEALLGSLDLALGDFAAAAARLRPLTTQLPGLGRRPNTQAIMPDAIEALIGTGQLEDAAALLADHEQRYRDPFTAAAAARCRGALAAARGRLDDAAAELGTALRRHDQISPEPVQRGRTLLHLGSVQRRRRQRGAARATLGEAAAVFEQAGAALWMARAREELARVSGRAPGTGELTAAELRVAELVAGGLSNRAAAAELFVTVRTIESTLTRIYAKLGVESRTQLASHLHSRARSQPG